MKKIVSFFNREQNLLIHICVSIIVIIASVILKLNLYEWMLIIFVISFVITTELFNSSIELAVDAYTNKFKELAMVAKDVAAGAVVLSAFTSVVVGLYVFLPKILSLLNV